ncbi:MAG: hypothetical protein A2252_07990 [Elusimicrobia bacterium RIFOXYA2_FULL_39_19]|nr:MAG: hypothetical protein A2252_07990 [Elusimicrobia bacterium RIFOXYA2_FULL_39_19]
MKLKKTQSLRALLGVAISLFIFSAHFLFSETRASASYKFISEVVDSAGGQKASGSYKITDAVGQMVQGSEVSNNYKLKSGIVPSFPDQSPPNQITDFNAVTDLQVKLTWTVPDGNIKKYQIKYSSDATKTASTAEYQQTMTTTTVAGQSVAHVMTGLQPQVTYYFWIRSADSMDNWAVWSDTVNVRSGNFGNINSILSGISNCSLVWGDYDNDGDLDLVIAGYNGSVYVTQIYRNNGNGFSKVIDLSPGIGYCSLAWGDYDNDGYLDLAMAGYSGSYVTQVYHNDAGNSFSKVVDLIGVYNGSLAWGDYDNDGYLDLALAGNGDGAIKIYHNNNGNGTFTNIEAFLEVYGNCSLAWGDYDNDGKLDFAIAGFSTNPRFQIFHNNGNGFVDSGIDNITGIKRCSVVWGDYDNDGRLDLAIAGNTGSGYITQVYHNDAGNSFSKVVDLTGVEYCSLSWGDYDNDGYLDLVVAGDSGSGYIAKTYHNNNGNGTFNSVENGLPGVKNCSLSWGDYDNDGDLDLAIAGDTSNGYITKIYKSMQSEFDNINSTPNVPSNLASNYNTSTNNLELRWDYGSDTETTEQKGLYYSVRVATEPITDNLKKWIVSPSTGAGATPFLGNYAHGFVVASSTRPGLNLGSIINSVTYYWQVATIDTGLRRSTWSVTHSIFIDTITPSAITDLTVSTGTSVGVVILNWTAPGDDGTSGNIVNGKFNIQYSSHTGVVWSNDSAQISISTSCSPLTLQIYTLSALTVEATYYFRIWTADEMPCWSGLSNGATIWVDCVTGDGYGYLKIKKGPDPTFKLNEVYAYPNPAKNGADSIIHIECGIADDVEIKLHNIAGELVNDKNIAGIDWQVMDNKYCYEYTVEANSVASGVYIYYIDAQKSGEKPIKVVKKLAIIR